MKDSIRNSLLTFLSVIAVAMICFASEKICSTIRASEICGSASYRAMDSSKFVFWNRVYLELPDSDDNKILRGDRIARSAKFIPRKQWVVAGADDMYIRVYNYNTMDKVKVFEAHSDYIRCVAVHPTLPYVLSSSDDMLIKLWDWENGWACTQIFEGHSHYVMQVVFNPKDTNTFASASLDRSIKNLYWAESGDLVAIASDTSFYILKFNRDLVSSHFASGRQTDEEGVEDAFEVLHENDERVRTGIWVGDCFIYNNSSSKLNYCVGGEVTTMYHLDRPMYLLGYIANQSRVYLVDKEFNVIGYTLLLSLIEYKTLVMRGDLDKANEILPTIPKEQHNNVAHFLESRGMIEDALEVATDPDYRFELAIQLGRLQIAKEIAEEVQSESKWKQLGELAMSSGKVYLL
ncbi:hypothetical protein F2Q68_00003036 [Brassica cretica]|uniref:Coatomer WD associated region domain-containing protein n=1 Tax=Brassica cretica TaxID=69181 RepID=A0A8S9JIW7_BRACR|nr:hypothetical protein F2Q68_00003036 [Brassica cretica]